MQENAAQRYTQAIVVPPDLEKVDWQAKPFPFKLYRLWLRQNNLHTSIMSNLCSSKKEIGNNDATKTQR